VRSCGDSDCSDLSTEEKFHEILQEITFNRSDFILEASEDLIQFIRVVGETFPSLQSLELFSYVLTQVFNIFMIFMI